MQVIPKKRLGQNFLIDPNILRKIVKLSGVNKKDTILEIGAGYGNLTKLLCEKAGFVRAIEIDKDLCELAKQNLTECNNVEVICGDFLKDPGGPIKRPPGSFFKVIANLPYYITTPIITKLLENRKYINDIYITIQKEVGERIVAKAGTKDYSALTCFVNYFTKPKILLKIPKTCFKPRPEVDSCLVRLEVLPKPSVRVKDEELMFKLIRAAFNQRRKTLLNALTNASSLSLPKQALQAALEKAKIDPKRRGETLTLQDFSNLTSVI